MTSRGMNYWETAGGRDQRLIFAMDGLLQELDAKTGKPILSFGTNGVVDLRAGIDGRDPARLATFSRRFPVRCSRISSSWAAPPARATCRRPATFAPTTS
jgi:quinoprotein glucose dehydrogenase